MNVDLEIQKLINELKKEYRIPSYIYNNDKFIPGTSTIFYSGPFFDDKELVVAIKELLVGKWISNGENTKEFEHIFSRKFKQLFSVFVNSGSSANLIMISALKKFYKWENGDEVIISAVGFPTSYAPLIQNNLVPKLIDIELETLNFDLSLIEQNINSRTRAVLLSPVLANPPDMDELKRICDEHDLILILDNCDSLGTKWNDKYLTEYSEISSCSFFAAHHICTLEGGMVSSSNRELMNIARKMVNWGKDCACSGVENLLSAGICNHRHDTWLKPLYNGIVDHRYVFSEIGYNVKGLELQSSIGIEQMEKFETIKSKRQLHKKMIANMFLEYIPDVRFPLEYPEADVSNFGVAVITKTKEQKDKLVKYLESHKIQTRNFFSGNITLQPAYKHLGNYKDYPNANLVLSNVFFVGCAPHYTEETLDYIRDVLKSFKE